ncbi:MAG: hypothetical protein NVS4B1_05720 [Ktedonobacteraceae bacterium]
MPSLLMEPYRYRQLLWCLIFCVLVVLLHPFSSVYAASRPKPSLTLNVQEGPLGVALTLKGKNFHAGQAHLKYVDAQKTLGTFEASSGSSVQVQHDGTFTATNLLLPGSGPVGVWNIIVTDSAKTVATIPYHVLAIPGEQSATTPSILLNPTNGKAGDVVAISGSNWLPQGTHVKLAFLDANNALIPLDTSLVSDKNGMVTGAVRIPSQFGGTQTTMTIVATDVTAALKAQTALTLLGLSPTPSPGLTPTKALSAEVSPAGPKDPGNLSFTVSTASFELVLLVVGSTLGVAALMLILFLIPWRKPPHEQVTLPHRPYRRW